MTIRTPIMELRSFWENMNLFVDVLIAVLCRSLQGYLGQFQYMRKAPYHHYTNDCATKLEELPDRI